MNKVEGVGVDTVYRWCPVYVVYVKSVNTEKFGRVKSYIVRRPD